MSNKIMNEKSNINISNEYLKKIQEGMINKLNSSENNNVETFDFNNIINKTKGKIEKLAQDSFGNYKNEYELYKNIKTKYDNVDSQIFVVSDYKDMIDTSKDKSVMGKNYTLGLNGEKIIFSERRIYKNGEIIYTDSKGKIVKRIDGVGTVNINGYKIYNDGTVTNPLGQKLLNDGSCYDAKNKIRTFADGTKAQYDEKNNVVSIESNGKTVKYNGDDIEVSRSTEKGYEQTTYSNDGSYKVKQYEPNDGNTYTTTYYDKNGNQTGSDKTYKTTDQYGDHIVVESDNKKTVYNGDGSQLKYTEEKNGDETVKTTYSPDGSVNEVEKAENGKVTETVSAVHGGGKAITDSNGNTTSYNANGEKTTTFKSDGGQIQYYDNGQKKIEIYSDGSAVGYDENGNINYEQNADGSSHHINADGSEEWVDADGNVSYMGLDGQMHTY